MPSPTYYAHRLYASGVWTESRRMACLYSTVCGFSWENHLEVYLLTGLACTGGCLGYHLAVTYIQPPQSGLGFLTAWWPQGSHTSYSDLATGSSVLANKIENASCFMAQP